MNIVRAGHSNNRRKWPVGMRVQIVEGCGSESGKQGIVIPPELDHRGIPKVDGAYRPFEFRGPMAERMLLLDDGTKTVMFTALLRRLQWPKA